MRLRWSKARLLSATAISAAVLAVLVTLPTPLRAAAPEMSFSAPRLRFAGVVVGQTETLVVVATNHGQSRVTVSDVRSTDSRFKVSTLKLPQVLAAGESLAVSVTFSPTAKGGVGGSVILSSNASNRAIYLALAGTGVTSEQVTVNPRNLSFGNVEVGVSSTLAAVVTNTGQRKVVLDGWQTEGAGFSVSGATFPLVLPAGKALKLDITFKPQAVGPVGGSSFVSGPNLNIAFTGIGIGVGSPELAITPFTLSFGDVVVGAIEKRTVELSAIGGGVTISSVSSSNSQFAVLDTSFPLTIPVGRSVSVTVAFTPQSNGTPSATLSFASNAADSPARSGLTGTGTAAFVSLSWIASTSPEVMGYNIYRKASLAGSYAKINSRVDPDTTYTDATVVHGTTYYYATTAVNSKGKESDYSNRVEVVVP
jgi:Abnormal spindle-like microcephaly-assoc'd, ASPM-SPD-2-Hydin